jgi:hypothetical protein
VVLHGAAGGGIYVYDYDATGEVSFLAAEPTAPGTPFTHWLLPGRQLRVMVSESVARSRGVKYRSLDIDLASCRITEATEASSTSSIWPEDLYAGGRVYHFGKRTSARDQDLQVFESVEAVANGTPREISFSFPVIDGNQIAGFKGNDPKTIHMVDLSDWRKRQEILLSIPERFWKDDLVLRIFFNWFGWQKMIPDNQSLLNRHVNPLTLGGGYLGYWDESGLRVALWDVHDLDRVRFLGVCDSPPRMPVPDIGSTMLSRRYSATTPFLRSDGTIGFLNDFVGPVWLTFPALIKEGA